MPLFITSDGVNNFGANINHDRYTQINLGNHCTVILEIVNGKIEVVDAMRKGDITILAKEITVKTFGRAPQADGVQS